MIGPTLRIRILGELEIRYGATLLPRLESARAPSLLAYLLLHRQAPQSRQRLAFLLWPDSTESQARTNLRHVLHDLRRALPEPDRFLEVTSSTLWWRPVAPFWLDIAAFEEAVARARPADEDSALAALREAVDLYAGDVLEACYDEWLLDEREPLRQHYLAALERLTGLLAGRGRHAEAIPYAERLLRHDPLHEETYRLLMRLHDARGDRARALHVYHGCTTALERELGVEPSKETRELYEALLPAERDHAAPEDRAGRAAAVPLVGRTTEWSVLTSQWSRIGASGARLILVTGEAGIGKTRLVEEFRSWCLHRGAVTASARSYAAEGALAYAPLAAWLRSEPIKPRLHRLDHPRLTELARLLPELLAEIPRLPRPDPLPESDQRQRLFDAAARALLGTAGPLLLVADDLQWWDRETLQFVHYLLRADPTAPLLVAATARTEDADQKHPLRELVAGLHALGRFSEIVLGRLSREETAVLAERAAGHPIAGADADQIYRETEGSPLFVVEALRTGWKSGNAGRGWTSPKVQAVIESRLDQLSEPAQDLVGLAATIGRAFTSDMLALAGELDEKTLVRALDELWRRGIVREQGGDAYDFSHDKIREVAYRGLSPARRRHHHLRAAVALERLHAGDPGAVSGQIAGHYELAGAAGTAVAWYERAAEEAQRLYANHEAVRLLTRGLELLGRLPPSRERDVRELAILTALTGPVAADEGFGPSRLLDLHRRSGELARALGVELAPPLLRSRALAALSDDDFGAAHGFGLQLRTCGERDADEVLLVEGEYVLGLVEFWSGDLRAARDHFQTAVDLARPEHRHGHLLRYGQLTPVVCLSRLGNTQWLLGCPAAAIQARDAALSLADEIGDPFTRSVVLLFAALLAFEMRDPVSLRAYVAALRDDRAATRPQHEAVGAYNLANSDALAGYVEVLDGRQEAGVARIQAALDESSRTQHRPGKRAYMMRLLLESHATAGNPEGGLVASARALEMGSARLWEAEVHRLRAEFLAALGARPEDVEMELARALEIAGRQGAKIFELRAMTSLLRHRTGRADGPAEGEARARLAVLVESLAEATDTPDLREAHALLE